MGSCAARVAFINLGCRLNRVETDLIATELKREGCVVVDKHDADVVIINTCAVTGEAETKTRKTVRAAVRLAQEPLVIATGCVASLFADELRQLGPHVVVEPRKDKVAERVLERLGAAPAPDDGPMGFSTPTPTGRMRPGIKIQDGCDNRCSFCIVWKARGPSRSVRSDRIVRAVREACSNSAHEVVLSGINLGSYRTGNDDPLGPGKGLDRLLAHLLSETSIERVRLSSMEPPDVCDELLEVMASSDGRIAPFLHVCLQSGSDATLKRMRRVYTTSKYAHIVKRARDYMPNLTLGTDLIVGFPGETDEEFEASREFCERMRFAKMHVFRYSARPGTPAATMDDQVSPMVMAQRSSVMRDLAQRMRLEQVQCLVGKTGCVLVQSEGHAVTEGLFDVRVKSNLNVGELVNVQFVGESNGWLEGEAL